MNYAWQCSTLCVSGRWTQGQVWWGLQGFILTVQGKRQSLRKGVTPGRQQRVKMVLWQDKCCIMIPENRVQLLPVTTTQDWKITSLKVYFSWTYLGCICRKSDGKMQSICHPQQGHANTKVTVGVADSQDFAMFWQLICHKCHSSPHKTIAFLWGGGDRRKSDFLDAETNMQLWVHADSNLGKWNHWGTHWTSTGCLICDCFRDVLHQEFLTVGGGSNRAWLWNNLRFLYHFCLSELWPSKQFLFSSKKMWKARKNIKTTEAQNPKNCVWLAPPCLCVKLTWLSSLTFIF